MLVEHTTADVVEPPKFITAKHVAALFDKLGYDSKMGQKIFAALCEALARRGELSNLDEEEDESMMLSPPTQSTLSTQQMRRSRSGGKLTVDTSTGSAEGPGGGSAELKSPNAALAAAFAGDEDEGWNSSRKGIENLTLSDAAAPPPGSPTRGSTAGSGGGGGGGGAGAGVERGSVSAPSRDWTRSKMDFADFLR